MSRLRPVDLRLEADITKKAESTIEQNDIARRCSNEGYRSQVILFNLYTRKITIRYRGNHADGLYVVDIAHHAQKNIFVIVVVSTKTSRGDTFAQIKQKNGTKAQFHLTISPRYYG